MTDESQKRYDIDHQEGEVPRGDERPEVDTPVDAHTETISTDVNALVGTETQNVLSFEQAKTQAQERLQPSRSNEMEQSQKVEQLGDALNDDVIRRLSDIEKLADRLVRMNMEHRLGDIRDYIPFLDMQRSHTVAQQEGDVINSLKKEVGDLDTFIKVNGLAIDISELSRITEKFQEPGGPTMILATIAPWLRRLHRGIVAPGTEKLSQVAGQIRSRLQSESTMKRVSRVA
jgi:hypothetical protein